MNKMLKRVQMGAAVLACGVALLSRPDTARAGTAPGQGCTGEELAAAMAAASQECFNLGYACYTVENCCEDGHGGGSAEGGCNDNTPCAEYFEPYSGPPCPDTME